MSARMYSQCLPATLPASSFAGSSVSENWKFGCTSKAFPALKGPQFVTPARKPALRGPIARVLRPVEERFRIQTEKNVSKGRLEELGVSRWSRWECGKCIFPWEWQVDEQVYIVKGFVRVTPDECEDSACFYAGDLVRFPKWFVAHLSFDGEYEARYRFRAYGDD